MIKLLLGGSPCTHWSIAKTKNRETVPKGMGWELFKNYLIALEKFKPNYFLYENNKSMSLAIKNQITNELKVEPIMINSALVSAQNRQRLYWTNIPKVELPQDKKIFIEDILEYSSLYSKNILIPINITTNKKSQTLKAQYAKNSIANFCCYTSTYGATGVAILTKANNELQYTYKVQDGKIIIKNKKYPTNLSDGFYIIRKLSVRECMRLQTVPEDFVFPVSDTQAYKMLGNGWTVDVIAHILYNIPKITTESLKVLSMYDGMSCGQIALQKLNANIIKYYATEIDKYAILTTQTNFPNTIQLGDAFQIREENWKID